MDSRDAPQITDIQRYDGGVLVVFDNARHFFYSADLLREMSARGKELTEQGSGGGLSVQSCACHCDRESEQVARSDDKVSF